MIHLPPVASAILTMTGVTLAVIRLLTASKAFWWKFPEWAQKGLPAALVALGALPPALEAAKSWLDVAVAFIFAVGAWFTASRGDKRPVEPPKSKPEDPDQTVRIIPEPQSFFPPDRSRLHNDSPDEPAEFRRWSPLVACVLAALSLTGCLGKIDWPKVVACATSAEYPLVVAVEKALDGTGDIVSELAGIARKYGPDAVICAVKQIAGDLGTVQLSAQSGHRAARAREFLGKVAQ